MRVRRNVSALAALILVGASVAAGVSPAAADGNWTFDGVEPLYTSASFTLTGQSDPGYVDVVPSEGTGCENVYSSPTWTCVITVEDSVQNLSIELRDHTTGTLHETAATSVPTAPRCRRCGASART